MTITRNIKRLYHRLKGTKPTDMPSVQYWKTKEFVQAKVTKAKDGSTVMIMEGEKEPFPGFPRGHILIPMQGKFAPLSILKHEIKNQVFNESWRKLEAGEKEEKIIADIKSVLFGQIAEISELTRYDRLPPTAMCPAVREIHRALTVVAGKDERILNLRDYLCFILQEDDAYRFRVQWMVKFFNPGWLTKSKMLLKMFNRALEAIENAEVIGDMKERIRLLRRVLMLALKDPAIFAYFKKFSGECDWTKVLIGKSDMYHFRGKYFKADHDILTY